MDLSLSLNKHVSLAIQASEEGVEVVHIDTDDSQDWAFEMLQYIISEIPSIVLLDDKGVCSCCAKC